MKELFFVLFIVIIFLLIHKRISKKGKSPGCGIICQLLQKPTSHKKPKTYKESLEEAKKRIGRIKKEQK